MRCAERKFVIVAVCAFAWMILVGSLNLFLSHVPGHDVRWYSCHTDAWSAKECGMGGHLCTTPSLQDDTRAIRCPARCGWSTIDGVQNYIDGTGPYLATSSLCGAAVHAGHVHSTFGGCAVFRFRGPHRIPAYTSSSGLGDQGVVDFPQSFEMLPAEGARFCTSLEWLALLSAVCGLCALSAMLGDSLRDARWRLQCMCLSGAVYLMAASERAYPGWYWIETLGLIFILFGFLPFVWWVAARLTLVSFTSEYSLADGGQGVHQVHMEVGLDALGSEPRSSTPISPPPTTVVRRDSSSPGSNSNSSSSSCRRCDRYPRCRKCVGRLTGPPPRLTNRRQRQCYWAWAYFLPFFLGLHIHFTVYFLPDMDFNSEILSHGAYGVILLVVVILVVLGMAVQVLCQLRRETFKTKRAFLMGYAGLFTALTLVSVVSAPQYSLHLHHSFIPLCLVPLTRFDVFWWSAPIQAAMVGVFVNGLFRWGWETQWDQVNSVARPVYLRPSAPVVLANSSDPLEVVIGWEREQYHADISGVNLNINDVWSHHVTFDQDNADADSIVLTDLVANHAYELKLWHWFMDLQGPLGSSLGLYIGNDSSVHIVW